MENKTWTFEELESRLADLLGEVKLARTVKELDRATVYDLDAFHGAYTVYFRECAMRDELELRVGDVVVSNRNKARYQVTELCPIVIEERYQKPEIFSRVRLVLLLKSGKPSEHSTSFGSYSQIRDHYDVERTGMLSTVRQREKRQLEAERGEV